MIATQPVLAAERRRLELTARHLSEIEYAMRRLAQAAAGGGTGE
jgi:hypothetical protein